MSTLRVLLSASPAATRAEAWTLFDDSGRVVDRGRDTPDRWPAAARRDAVLAAGLVRLIALALPPMSASRLASAAAYALEDRLAADDAPAIGVSAPRADGSALAVVTARATLDAVAAHAPRFTRIVAEPALAPVNAGWTWYAGGASGGFVRTEDGGAFAVGTAPSAGPLPPELAAALAQAAHTATAPREVIVAERCSDDVLAAWRAATGVTFVRGDPWRWDAAPGAAFDAAPDLLHPDADAPAPARGAALRLWKPAAAIVGAALALHVVATVAQWAWLRVDAWRTGDRVLALAQGAGLADATSPEAALRALARRDADLRHRAGLAAPADALPLLARAAPALAALPPAAVKTATFADGAWTFELATQDDAARATLDRRLQDAGLTALQARTNAGYRMRVTPAP